MSDVVFGFGALPRDLVANIAADEIGLEFGVHGEFRLRCAIQPIFRHEDGRLTPIAADAKVVPYREGQPVAVGEFLAEMSDEERSIVGRIWAVLPLANAHNMGFKGIALLFRQDVNGDAPDLDDLGFMAQRLKGEGFEASQLICEIGGDEQLACALRALGMRVALGHHGSAEHDGDAVKRVLPDIVRLDRASFERFCADAATGRLMRLVVSELKTLGADVLVEGIDNESRLEIALGAGVDLLQGDLLEPAKLVGSVFGEGPRETSQYRRGECVVVPLFG